MAQIKNSFDPITITKIKKGCIRALSGPLGVAVISLALSLPKTTWWLVGISWLLPAGINAVIEYNKGEPK